MLILLSPAKTLAPAAPSGMELSSPALLRDAQAIVSVLKTWTMEDTQRTLGLSDKLAATVHQWHQDWRADATAAAGWTFKGDAFKSLDLPSLPEDALRRAQTSLCILNGVYGLLRPMDAYAPVRLEMGQAWSHAPDFKTMAAFWKTRLPEAIAHAKRQSGHDLVLNLASAEYGDVALHGWDQGPVVTCAFLENRGGTLKSISSFAKTARGAMARHVLTKGIERPEALDSFSELGYVLDPEQSAENHKVFVRTLTP